MKTVTPGRRSTFSNWPCPRAAGCVERTVDLGGTICARLHSASRSPNAKSGSWDRKNLLRILAASNGVEAVTNDVRHYVPGWRATRDKNANYSFAIALR